jgi:metallophosphoesterase (TIGR00282 family)
LCSALSRALFIPRRCRESPCQQRRGRLSSLPHEGSHLSAIRVLFLGEIVGKAGVWCLKELLPKLKKQHAIDFTIADGEGATGGFGLGKNHSMYIRKLGVDVITMGECSYYKKDMVEHIAASPWILRPANYPQRNPGRGFGVYEAAGRKIAVICLLGQANFRRIHLKNPFSTLPKVHDVVAAQTNTIIVDFHAVTTAEKNTMFWHADGKVSAIVGTHTKAPTADERIMPGRTAVVTDVGRVGSIDGVGGLDTEVETRKLTTLVHEYSKETWGKLELQAVVIEIGDDGLATGITRIREAIDSPPQPATALGPEPAASARGPESAAPAPKPEGAPPGDTAGG